MVIIFVAFFVFVYAQVHERVELFGLRQYPDSLGTVLVVDHFNEILALEICFLLLSIVYERE